MVPGHLIIIMIMIKFIIMVPGHLTAVGIILSSRHFAEQP